MKKKERIYFVVFLSVLALVVWINANIEEDVWQRSFQRDDTRAYGGRVLFETLPYLLEDAPLSAVDVPPYELLSDSTLRGTNYLFITSEFKPDDAETEALIRYVSNGNVVFVAAEIFQGSLPEKLSIRTSNEASISGAPDFDSLFAGALDTTWINLFDERMAVEGGYFYSNELFHSRILPASEDSTAETAGVAFGDAAPETDGTGAAFRHEFLGAFEGGGYNFVKIGAGQGYFLISTVPLAFTNYNILLDDNGVYAYNALSYLPAQSTFWDRYYKPNRSVNHTPIGYILSSSALRTAYFILMGAILLFMSTKARRRQRIIPVVPAKENTTVEFAHTMGRLYMNQSDHVNLAHKMLDQFRYYVYYQLNLPGEELAPHSAERIAARAGLKTREVESLLSYLADMRGRNVIDAASLLVLAKRLERFYAGSKR